MNVAVIKELKDEWFTLVVYESMVETEMRIELYEHESQLADGTPTYACLCLGVRTRDVTEATATATCTMKHDGQSMWWFKQYWEPCSKQQLENFGKAMLECHDLAQEIFSVREQP